MRQDQTPPKWELFTGYQWLAPGGTVPEPFQPYNSPVGIKPPGLPKGFGVSLTRDFGPIWGLEGDFGHNWGDFGYETTVSAGPRVGWRSQDTNFFLHTLVSYNRFNENGIGPKNGIGAILGGGMDLLISHRISYRLFEADYVWAHQNYADQVSASFPALRRPSLEGVRLRTGIVWNFGGAPETPVAASCSVQPAEVMVGEPITATANATGFNPKHTLTYTWSSTGGKITGKDTTASIDTNGMAGGSYVVTAHVTDAKAKHNNEASCTANFTVKEPPKNPPTMSCSANPDHGSVGWHFESLLHLHQPGQCAGHGERLDRDGRNSLRQRGERNAEYHRRSGGHDHGERDLHRYARADGFLFVGRHGGSTAASAAASQQAERVRLLEDDQNREALARGQRVQGHPG